MASGEVRRRRLRPAYGQMAGVVTSAASGDRILRLGKHRPCPSSVSGTAGSFELPVVGGQGFGAVTIMPFRISDRNATNHAQTCSNRIRVPCRRLIRISLAAMFSGKYVPLIFAFCSEAPARSKCRRSHPRKSASRRYASRKMSLLRSARRKSVPRRSVPLKSTSSRSTTAS